MDPIVQSGLSDALGEVTSLLETQPSQAVERAQTVDSTPFYSTNVGGAHRRDNLSRAMCSMRETRDVSG